MNNIRTFRRALTGVMLFVSVLSFVGAVVVGFPLGLSLLLTTLLCTHELVRMLFWYRDRGMKL